jgi:hypothetical protein
MSEKNVTLPVTGMTCADFALNIKRNVAEPILGLLLQRNPGAVGSRSAPHCLLGAGHYQGSPSGHGRRSYGPLQCDRGHE